MTTATNSGETVLVRDGAFAFRIDAKWLKLPPGWSLVEVAAVATDAAGNVLVFNRGQHPIVIFDRDGNFLRSWGEGLFARPHGITIDSAGCIYCTDDSGHCVRKFSPAGELLLTLGTPGVSSETGARTVDYRTIQRAAGPFNFPTNVAIAPTGELYVTDGYGNARVHRFSPEGHLIASWGEPGQGPVQFNVPHGIAIDAQGIVVIADRENSRLQWFSSTGEFIDEWRDIARPNDVTFDRQGNVYVAELGYRAGMFPGNAALPGQTTGGRLSIFSRAGEMLARFGGGENPCATGDFFAPHDVWVDPFGDVYVGEVTMSAGGNRGLVPPECHVLQKLVRVQDTP
ncbi:MAG TPA: peptidyl-alpha-hydroxyglycine alpha-amidating lyase family protein [Pirellulales bacterium]